MRLLHNKTTSVEWWSNFNQTINQSINQSNLYLGSSKHHG